MQVELSYNPYTVKTGMVVDGDELESTSELLGKYQNKRIQDWIDNFFMDMVTVYRELDIEYDFFCTAQDFLDIKSAFESFLMSVEEGKGQFVLSPHISDVSAEEKIEQLKALFEEAKEGPFDEFRGEELGQQFEAALSPDFEVNVIATMSSGKSTVINALLGQDLMPSKNEACTATVVRIEDCEVMEKFEGCSFNDSGEEVDLCRDVDKACLERWNSDTGISQVALKGNIQSIKTSDSTNLVLVDTPGPNNSQNVEHRRMTYETIQSKPLSMVLYVLNATQLNINDDVSLLRGVSEAMSSGGRQAQDRFVFIANKIDAYDPEQGESVTSALKSAQDYLKKNNIANPLIVPASAELSKLIRLDKRGDELTRAQKNKLRSFTELFVEEDEMNLVEHVKNSINPRIYESLSSKLTQCGSDQEKAAILSGIPIIEELLNDFLVKHAVPAKIKDAVDCFGHVMAKAKGLERLNSLLDKNERDLAILVDKIEKFENDQDRIQKADDFRESFRNQKYNKSHEIKDSMRKVLKEKRMVQEEVAGFLKLKESLSPKEAKGVLDKALGLCEGEVSRLANMLTEGMGKECTFIIENFRGDYSRYIEDMIKEKFPLAEDAELAAYHRSEFSIPDLGLLIKNNSHKKRVESGYHYVSTSKWWNPFSWGSSRRVTDYEEQERVDMVEIAGRVNKCFAETITKNMDLADQQIQSNFEDAKKTLLEAMDKMDQVRKKHIKKFKEAAQERVYKQKIIEVNKRKKEWYDEFCVRLSNILAI